MIKIAVLITQEIADIHQLVRHLIVFNTTEFKVELVFIQHQKLSEENLNTIQASGNFSIKEIPFPVDEDLLFRDILKDIDSDYLINIIPAQVYPSDFLQNILQEATKDKTKDKPNRDPYKKRLLKAIQQSKYGMGVVKKDIKRDYPEFRLSSAYKISDFTKLNFLELGVSDHFATDLQAQSKKADLETQYYTPNYKEIEYYSDFDNYTAAIKNEAPTLSYRDKPNAIGLPLYMLIFIMISLLIAPFYISAIFPLLVMSALYLLALTLESLAVSTLKKQGDLFPGLMVLFMFIHFYYLWYYLFSKVRNVH